MEVIRRYKWAIVAVGLAIAVIGFLLFRPDKLFVDDVVDESLTDAFTTTSTTSTSTTGSDRTDDPTTTTTDADSATTTTMSPPGPVAVSTGTWVGIDHSAVGTATVYELDDQFVLRFEDDTDIQNGPDLYIWVLPGEEFTGDIPEGYLDLGKIKGNVGGQNYELPDAFDPAIHRTVLVWCLRFSTPFAAASLA